MHVKKRKANENFGKRPNENLKNMLFWEEINRYRKEISVKCKGVEDKSERLLITKDEV